MVDAEVGANRRVKIVSWGSVIAGAVTVLAVSVLLSLLASGMGLGQVDADANNPLGGVGATFGWSSAILLLLRLSFPPAKASKSSNRSFPAPAIFFLKAVGRPR